MRKLFYVTAPNPTEQSNGKKKRQRLSLEGYKAVYEIAPDWLQDAMEFALITLQARHETANARFDDEKDGFFHIIREKTKEKTERAYIRFPVEGAFKELLTRCRARPIASPFLIAKSPDRRNRKQMEAKEHWAQVLPDYLGKGFQKYRDQCGFFEGMEMDVRPTFHEIRSLGGDTYIENGYSKEYVNLLYGHTTIQMTEEYLKGHEVKWSNCEAGLNFRDIMDSK